jgi:citronellyl-CoA dehydrogenase
VINGNDREGFPLTPAGAVAFVTPTQEVRSRAMRFTEEHQQLRRTVRDFVEKEVNPSYEEWEKAGVMPLHDLFKKAGRLGLLGVNKPEAYGGMGLDYSYQMCVTEELGWCKGGSFPMAFGVQTDMATPALARWGSDELRKEFLAPARS